ncbi:MAG TPA: aminoglycoside 6'-N-acetyltransferase [Rhizobacter sp.]|nr:aminoglycoside 6'-N-acetyltransferase [Rhizobacter sp.]
MPAGQTVELRLMREDDLPLLHTWLNRPHVAVWWGNEQPTLDEVREQYLPSVLARDGVTPYIASVDGVPFAYAQSYVALGSGEGWWEDETDPGVRGIDQSIGEPSLLDQGLGTRLVRALLEHLFADPSVTKVQTDPSPDNARAIRCYEKAGFRRVKTVVTPDGPAVYMLCERPRGKAGG